MLGISISDLIMIMAVTFFALGTMAIIAGMVILVGRSLMGSEVKTIAVQAARLGQKGIAEDVAGLVGNASALLESLNSLIKTSTGIGVSLIFIGILLNAAAYFLTTQIRIPTQLP